MAGGKLISTGVEFPDATTQTTSGLPLTGGTMTGTIAGFTSTGIDDNATSTAITIDASENVGINNTNPAHALDVTGDIEVSGRIALGTGASQVATVNAYSRDVASNVYSAIRIIDSTTASTHFDVGLTGTDLKFYHNSVYPPKMTLSSAGQLTIKDNLVIGTSGKGIDFSATSDGSGTMTSEVLDDYEEGTWTPTTNGDATGVFSGSVYGKYVKVGTLVYATFNFTVSTSFTGNSIGGLPYAVGSLSGSSVRPSMPIWFNAGSADYMIMTTIGGGGSYVGFSKFSGYQAWSPLINNNIRGTVIYQSA